jgi:hypothetical protein
LLERLLQPIHHPSQDGDAEHHERHNHHSRNAESGYAYRVREIRIL